MCPYPGQKAVRFSTVLVYRNRKLIVASKLGFEGRGDFHFDFDFDFEFDWDFDWNFDWKFDFKLDFDSTASPPAASPRFRIPTPGRIRCQVESRDGGGRHVDFLLSHCRRNARRLSVEFLWAECSGTVWKVTGLVNCNPKMWGGGCGKRSTRYLSAHRRKTISGTRPY